jgi:hypothetical protein
MSTIDKSESSEPMSESVADVVATEVPTAAAMGAEFADGAEDLWGAELGMMTEEAAMEPSSELSDFWGSATVMLFSVVEQSVFGV